MRVSGIRVFVPIVLSFVPPFLTALEIANWTVPPYRGSSASGGLTTMADVTPGIAFVGIQPCRVADTRGNGAPITGGIFANSALRTWDVTSICGIPVGTEAISVNFSVVAAGGIPAGSFLLAWPTGQSPPPTAIMTYGPGQIISNAAIVPLGPSEQLNVNVSGSTHVIMDVNGYFSDALIAGNQFVVAASIAASGAIYGTNTSGVELSAGVRGDSTAGRTFGVWGETASSTTLAGGVVGIASSTTGLAVGTWGQTASNTNGAIGVFGDALSTTGSNYGVYGQTRSTASGAAGVYGVDGTGDPDPAINNSVGVRAAGHIGLWASSKFIAVVGDRVNDAGVEVTGGRLGTVGTVGVASIGDIDATGTKLFVEPHPTDATKEIAYISLEGPEAGTYFRGRGRIRNGIGVISVPESFRLVSDEEGLTVQITPIGQAANVAVVSADLNAITVQSTASDVEFYCLVNGVRKAFNHHEAIRDNTHFVPDRSDHRMPLAYSPEQRRRLIASGIYNEDGTVNMETARRLGWDKEWEKRSRPAPQPFD